MITSFHNSRIRRNESCIVILKFRIAIEFLFKFKEIGKFTLCFQKNTFTFIALLIGSEDGLCKIRRIQI